MSTPVDRPGAPRVRIVRGGEPEDPGVVTAIARALELLATRAVQDRPDAWWRAGTLAAVTGQLARTPGELDGPLGRRVG